MSAYYRIVFLGGILMFLSHYGQDLYRSISSQDPPRGGVSALILAPKTLDGVSTVECQDCLVGRM